MIDVARQAEMLANRLRKTFRRLHPLFERQGVGAFRLYDRDIPEIRAVVDWYEGHLVVAEYEREQTRAAGDWLGAMAAAAAGALEVPPERVHAKSRRTRPASGAARYGRLARTDARLAVREAPLQFLVNLDDFIDTGLFTDHRRTRSRVRAEAAGKTFLNLFGYTGSFTCAAARGGARATTTVDASRNYLDWARENLDHNRLDGPGHELVCADAREFLHGARAAGRSWELCLLDPPSFSAREGRTFDVLRDHRALVDDTLAVLAAGGVLYFSTNHQRFEPALDGLDAREVTAETLPEDYRGRAPHRLFRIVRR